MLAKSSAVLLGLVVGIVSIVSELAVAQGGGPSVSLHRVCTITPGAQGAGAFARGINDYFDEKWPELQIVAFREALFPSDQIHWVTQYENMASWAEFRGVLFQDRGYQDLVQKGQGIFVPQSCVDTLFQNIE